MLNLGVERPGGDACRPAGSKKIVYGGTCTPKLVERLSVMGTSASSTLLPLDFGPLWQRYCSMRDRYGTIEVRPRTIASNALTCHV